MGPRSHERGNLHARYGAGNISAISLQWGRVLMNAETGTDRRRASR